MHDASQLATKTMAELKEIASVYGLGSPQNENKTQIIVRITAAMNTLAPETKNTNNKPVFAIHETTEEELRSALERFKGKEIEVRIAGDCWHFRCKGMEDSGTMKQPLSVIVRKAEEVSRGARNPRGIKAGGNIVLTA